MPLINTQTGQEHPQSMDEAIEELIRNAHEFSDGVSHKIKPNEATNVLLLSSPHSGGDLLGQILNDIFPDTFFTVNPLYLASYYQVSHINCFVL